MPQELVTQWGRLVDEWSNLVGYDIEIEEPDKSTPEARIEAHVDALRLAYVEVFSAGETSEGALRLVQNDLVSFCRVLTSAHTGNPHDLSYTEGMRAVFMRMMAHRALRFDELMKQYVMETQG